MITTDKKAQATQLLENNSAFSLATRLLQAEREKCIAEQEYMRMVDQCDQGDSKIKKIEEELQEARMEFGQSQQTQVYPVMTITVDQDGAQVETDIPIGLPEGTYRAYIGQPPAPAALLKCPYPCGWKKLNIIAMEKSAFIARGMEPGEEIKESHRDAAIALGVYLRTVLSTIIAAPAPTEPDSKCGGYGCGADGWQRAEGVRCVNCPDSPGPSSTAVDDQHRVHPDDEA